MSDETLEGSYKKAAAATLADGHQLDDVALKNFKFAFFSGALVATSRIMSGKIEDVVAELAVYERALCGPDKEDQH